VTAPASTKPKLVIGANGFLGSHVARQLVADGLEVRAMVRPNANTRTIDDLELARFHGDVFDTDTLREAMDGVDDVYYCVVDTRAWLRDTAPLFRTNVDGLRNVLDVAVKAPDLRRFIFTSTYATVGRRHGHVATEEDVIGSQDLKGLTPYVQSRVQAENLVMRYVAEAGLPAIAMCVSTTYGSGDWGGTPHGAFIAGAVFGKLPFLMNGIQLEVVGVDDAARAMVLAAERGRIGERYLVSERMIALNDVVRIAADEVGVPPPRRSISVPMLYAMAAFGTLRARLTGKDAELSLASVRMMRSEADVDSGKAKRELGWQPRPVEESIREAARFWAAMRAPRKSSPAA
jgi:nucleoside-diphosphate-sugar epimerase